MYRYKETILEKLRGAVFFSYIITIVITAGFHVNLISLVRNFTFLLSFDHHNSMTAIRASIDIPIIWMRKPRHKQNIC